MSGVWTPINSDILFPVNNMKPGVEHEDIQTSRMSVLAAEGRSLEHMPATSITRVQSLDFLRGLAMVIMALDHVRDFVHVGGFDPLDLTQTSPELFMTRWITHFCAPVFVFLAGTASYMSLSRGRTTADLSRFLITRGLWLVVLEVTIVSFGWVFTVPYMVFMQVIWAIGVSMIVLAGLIHLPIRYVAVFGLVMVGGHNLLDGVNWDFAGGAFALLHEWKFFQVGEKGIWFAYPLIPWIGVMALGYVFGTLYRLDAARRQTILYQLGFGLIALFIVLRFFNIYGNPDPWASQSSGLFTLFSFVKNAKYPPSLLFLLMTLGPAIVLLAALEKGIGRWGQWLIVFGRVPLFYYVAHMYLGHLSAAAIAAAMGYSFFDFFAPYWEYKRATGFGLSLGAAYLVWMVNVAVLYPVCVWYADLKKRNKSVWLTYL